MAVQQLTTPGKIVDAIERQGVMTLPISQLQGDEPSVTATLRQQGIENPKKLIDRVQQAVASRGDADGLYEDTDRKRALELLKRESKPTWER